MYLSPFTRMTDRAELQAVVDAVGVATVITVGADGAPQATLLPVLWEGDRLLAHAARANPQFRDLVDGTPALAVIHGANAYVSPNWYPTKAKAGRAVPTWNYVSVQLSGPLHRRDDPAWLRSTVDALAERHERDRDPSWSSAQAPEVFLDGLLLGIVGLEMTVTSAQGKAKLSQNRVAADRAGVIAGLRADSDCRSQALAEVMAEREERRASG